MNLEKRIDYYCLDGAKFKKIEDLKGGAYGSICIVEEEGTKNRYVAKIMTDFTQYDNQKYFLRELDIFIRVTNCCIIGFKGFSFRFNNLNIPTIFLEYAECGSIQSKLDGCRKNNPDPNWTATKRMISLIGVSHGMMKLHDQSVIHRDLKPGNVLLDTNYYPKITDFGLSKFENKTLEQSISGCGTPIYMAPEVVTSFDFTNSIDVFAFSIMAYEICTLRFPYQIRPKETPLNVINKVCRGMRPKFYDDDDLSPQMKDLIEKCWSENPLERYTFKEITQLLVQKEYYLPDVDINELNEYIKILNKDSEVSHLSNEASQLIKKADTDDLEAIKSVADNFFEGKNGFPHDEAQALLYYRRLSLSHPPEPPQMPESPQPPKPPKPPKPPQMPESPKPPEPPQMPESPQPPKPPQMPESPQPPQLPKPPMISPQPERKDDSYDISTALITAREKKTTFTKGKRSQTVTSPGGFILEGREKIDFVKLTQASLVKEITSFNIFVYGGKTAREAVIKVLSKNQTFNQKEVARHFVEGRIYGCGISLIEAQKIGRISEDEVVNFIKEKVSSKTPSEERLRHGFYCLVGDDDSFFTEKDERMVKLLSKCFQTTIIILQAVNRHFVDSVLKKVANCYSIEDAMSSLKNVKKGPLVVAVQANDDQGLFQKIQNLVNFMPNIV